MRRDRMFGLACAYAFVVFLLVSAALDAARRRVGGASGAPGSAPKPASNGGRGFFASLIGGGTPEVTLAPMAEVRRNATPPCSDMLRPAILVLCYNR